MNVIKYLPGKAGTVFCIILITASVGCTAYEERPRDEGGYAEPSGPSDSSYVEIRTESDFYEPLSPYGRWEVVGSYGRCWIPGGVDSGWSPYSNGYWQQTDAGWYWASDEPWGWATYHYGRWDSSPEFGWYWVPQTRWAPAWVSWRQGGGYVGWAPLSPSGRAVEVNRRGAAPGGYVFVEERRFMEPVRPAAVNVDITVINRTVINEGPRAAAIEQASGRKMQAVPARQLRGKEEAKIVASHPKPTSNTAKAAPAPVRSQAENPRPNERETRQPAPGAATARPETRPAANRETMPAPKPEARPEPKPEPRPEVKPEPKPERKPEARPEPKPEPRPEVKPEPKPDRKPEARPEPKPEPRPEVKPEPKPEAKPEVKHEAQPKDKVEPKPADERRQPGEQKPGKDDKKED
jgi:hypothetical protein